MDDIAVEQDGHAQGIQHPGCVMGRETLEWEGYRVEQGSRQGHHEEKKEQREGQHPEAVPTKMKEDQTRENDDQRAPHQEEFGTDLAEEERHDPDDEHRKADP